MERQQQAIADIRLLLIWHDGAATPSQRAYFADILPSMREIVAQHPGKPLYRSPDGVGRLIVLSIGRAPS
jgi:hypothetical protein